MCIRDRLRLVVRLVDELCRFPRHLSQHVGGFVITRGRLDHLCPISPAAMPGRTVIEWDKDDLDALGLLKVDVLALGMLSCIRRAFGLLMQHYNRPLTLAAVPPEDAATYDMLCEGKSVGVFQVESRAQMAMLPRLQPRRRRSIFFFASRGRGGGRRSISHPSRSRLEESFFRISIPCRSRPGSGAAGASAARRSRRRRWAS